MGDDAAIIAGMGLIPTIWITAGTRPCDKFGNSALRTQPDRHYASAAWLCVALAAKAAKAPRRRYEVWHKYR